MSLCNGIFESRVLVSLDPYTPNSPGLSVLTHPRTDKACYAPQVCNMNAFEFSFLVVANTWIIAYRS